MQQFNCYTSRVSSSMHGFLCNDSSPAAMVLSFCTEPWKQSARMSLVLVEALARANLSKPSTTSPCQAIYGLGTSIRLLLASIHRAAMHMIDLVTTGCLLANWTSTLECSRQTWLSWKCKCRGCSFMKADASFCWGSKAMGSMALELWGKVGWQPHLLHRLHPHIIDTMTRWKLLETAILVDRYYDKMKAAGNSHFSGIRWFNAWWIPWEEDCLMTFLAILWKLGNLLPAN